MWNMIRKAANPAKGILPLLLAVSTLNASSWFGRSGGKQPPASRTKAKAITGAEEPRKKANNSAVKRQPDLLVVRHRPLTPDELAAISQNDPTQSALLGLSAAFLAVGSALLGYFSPKLHEYMKIRRARRSQPK